MYRRGLQLISIQRSTRKSKKYMATFSDGTVTHFGGQGCGDFIKYSAKSRSLGDSKRRAYIARHGATESWTVPTTAATLSRYILWEKRTLGEAIRAYKQRFRL
jgi:hypothetical protein